MSETVAARFLFINATPPVERRVFFGTPQWRESLAWAECYGLDPKRIPAGSLIVADGEACCIRYERAVLDDDKVLIQKGRLVTERIVEQLEGPPLPLGHPMTLGGKR